MKNFFGIITIFAYIFLTGCEQITDFHVSSANEMSKNMTLVLGPGFEIEENGKAIPTFGTDQCPTESPTMQVLFGSSSTDGQALCVVVTPQTESVVVTLTIAEDSEKNLVNEKWDVVRDKLKPGSITFRRPNGDFVMSYDTYSANKNKT